MSTPILELEVLFSKYSLKVCVELFDLTALVHLLLHY